ncbi:MAG: TRAP transporter large permease subunit [Rhizobiaceae bacterium]|nr:TRAP transporter large permease subunit [Rhizobiaceae bacterium]
MSGEFVGLLGIAGLFILLALRMPVGLALLVTGTLGTWSMSKPSIALATLGDETWVVVTQSTLVVIPMFILMGNIASISGMSRNLYDAAFAFIGHRRGGLAGATIIGCGGFAALSGSSVASALTMGRVALPEMERFKYDDRLATGAVAAGGTLGILIPPSTGFIVYAILTEESIGQLFIAGILPGLLLMILFALTVSIVCWFNPELGPAGPRSSVRERVSALAAAAPLLTIILVTIGGIYLGVFTPVEAAGVGAVLTGMVAMLRGKVTMSSAISVLLRTVKTTAMTYLILIGAHVFTPFLARSRLPDLLVESLIGLGLGTYGTLVIILVALIILGTFLEGLAMLVLTLPIIFPIILALGFDPIWFGVLMVIVLEMGLITPPVGLNVFLVKMIAPRASLAKIFKGIAPFWVAMLVALILLVLFPQIALVLPQQMF